MSARGLGAEPIAFGHYPTPAHMATRLWEVCAELRNARAVCDPMADEGALLTTIRGQTMAADLPTYANEIRPEAVPALRSARLTSWRIGDAFDYDPPHGATIITNPDFALFERTARHFQYRDCPLILLGPAGYLAGGGMRNNIVADLGMPDMYLVPERPKFVTFIWQDETGAQLDKGSSDSTGSAWYVWCGPPRTKGSVTQLREVTEAEAKAHVPPRRIITVSREVWEKKGKKAPKLAERFER